MRKGAAGSFAHLVTGVGSLLLPVCAVAQGQTPQALRFIPVTPCRVLDTRNAAGTFGGPALAAGGTRNVPVQQSTCNIPNTASAYSLNVTVVPKGGLTFLTVWPAGQTQPTVSTLNSFDGRILANAAIVPAGTSGAINVFASDATDLIIDIDGYFAPVTTPNSLSFYTLSPCRIVDTRAASFGNAFGPPFLNGNTSRTFPIPASTTCIIPSNANAYSLNITVVPHTTLGYLTTWPAGQAQPFVSTLNSSDGAVVANAAIVPAGTGGGINVFVSNDADVIIDINGYFAAPGGPGALSLYTLAPCRIADTRGNGFTGFFGPPSLSANIARAYPLLSSSCNIPAAAQAYSLNFTVVPGGPLTFLAAWPAGQQQPTVSTLNSPLGKVVANAALVPAGSGGAISVLATSQTDLILDTNAYFAP
ncbi:MAG TPA: hypothetical protein VKU01_33180 [Bryobacteraceae bacterium]|nr:hypothetical protein [Bryobacteraceae bacterium]